MSVPIRDRRRHAGVFPLTIPNIAALTPCGSIFCLQPFCFPYFARDFYPNLMILKIRGGGRGCLGKRRRSYRFFFSSTRISCSPWRTFLRPSLRSFLGKGAGGPSGDSPQRKMLMRVPHPGRFCPGGSFDLSARRGGLGRLAERPAVGFNRRPSAARPWALSNRNVLTLATHG